MKNIQLIKTSNYRLEVEDWVCDRFAICRDEIEDIFYNIECELENRFEDAEINKELISEISFEVVSEYAFECLSIYNHDIVDALHELAHYEIDEIVEESGWIEYNGSYVDFARAVIGCLKERELQHAIENIIDQATEITFDKTDYNLVKADIINHLEIYRDVHIEGLAREAKRLQEKECTCGSYIESINEYICEMSYCGYMVENTLENRRKWETYKFYYIDFYSDKDIKQAVFNYVAEVDEANARAEKMEAENLEKITEISESGEDADQIESLIKYIDGYYNNDDRFKKPYQQLHLRLEYLHTIKYIQDVLDTDEENKVEQFIETMKAMRNPQSIKLLSEAITKLLS